MWTPGPWKLQRISEDRKFGVRVDGGNVVGYAAFISWDWPHYDQRVEQIANANLIAAAPELYEALDALLGGDDKLRVGIGGNPIYVDAFLAKAGDVLAKARGEVSL
jgi:hypothetical protein